MADSLSDIRRKIDALDARLVQLLSSRAQLAQRAWQAKGGAAAYKPEREAQVRLVVATRCIVFSSRRVVRHRS